LDKIIFDPYWYPTQATRKACQQKGVFLPKVIPPHHPLNAMGKVKFVINWQNTSLPILIHGTNEPASIGQKVTRGCIRMTNEDAVELAHILSSSQVEFIILP
jgi:L,D-transpeptidase YnhG